MGRKHPAILILLVASCASPSNTSFDDPPFDVWSRDILREYKQWRLAQHAERQTELDSLHDDLVRLYFYPPPGEEEFPRDTIVGWRERYLKVTQGLGERLRLLGPDAWRVVLAVFAGPAPPSPSDEPNHTYHPGEPDLPHYIRFLWRELIARGAMPGGFLRVPLSRALKPVYMLSSICLPAEPIREQLKVASFGWIQNPCPFMVRCNVIWAGSVAGPDHSRELLVVHGPGGGRGTSEKVPAPRNPGQYTIEPHLIFRVTDEAGKEFLGGTIPLSPHVVRVVPDADAAVDRIRIDAVEADIKLRVRWIKGPRQQDGSLWLAVEYTVDCGRPQDEGLALVVRPLVILENGSSFQLRPRCFTDGWPGAAGSELVRGPGLPARGSHRARLELHPDPAEARRAGYDRMADIGILKSTPFDLVIE